MKQVLNGIDERRQRDEERVEPPRKPIPVTIESTEQEKWFTQKTYFWTKVAALAAIIGIIITIILSFF